MAGVPGHSGAGGQATAGGTEHKGPATGVLITGCQSNETSADACPSGDPAKAFGALTNALTTIVNAQKGQNPQARPAQRYHVLFEPILYALSCAAWLHSSVTGPLAFAETC